MNTFDKVILMLNGAATAMCGASVAADLPKWLTLVCVAVSGACIVAAPTRQVVALHRAVKQIRNAARGAAQIAIVFFVAFATTVPAASCSFFQHPSPALSCLETLGDKVLTEAIDKIYTTIDNGTLSSWTEERIILELTFAAVGIAPDVWNCAMLYVANPDHGKPPAAVGGPKKATRSTSAVIAADYLAKQKQ
jgi:hypothetical protein